MKNNVLFLALLSDVKSLFSVLPIDNLESISLLQILGALVYRNNVCEIFHRNAHT